MPPKEDDELKNAPIHEAEDGSVVIGGEPPTSGEKEAKKESQDSGTEDDDDDDEDHKAKSNDEDEPGHEDESEEDAEARRERNRKRRQENRNRRKEYIDSLRREIEARDSIIEDLGARVSSVERSAVGSQMAQLDSAIREAQGYYQMFRDESIKAIEQANGPAATAAQEKMFAAKQRIDQLAAVKQNMSRQPSQPQPLDPRLKANAESWMAKNSWYDPSGKDPDSRIALTIDQTLVEEGWNPTTPQYWEELEARVKKYLPHRNNSGYNSRQESSRLKPKVPVAGSGRETGSNRSSGGYHLSAERVRALKDAGVWDDPVKRADAIRRFKEYDAQSASNK